MPKYVRTSVPLFKAAFSKALAWGFIFKGAGSSIQP